MTSKSASDQSRHLSIYETLLENVINQEEPSLLILTSTLITSKLKIPNEIVNRSFETLTEYHPLLACTISKDTEDYRFVNVVEYSEKDISNNSTYCENNQSRKHAKDFFKIKFMAIENRKHWLEKVYNELQDPFASGELLWRALWLEVATEEDSISFEYVLVFICHHGMIDGKGVFDLIVNQFFPVLQEYLTKNESSVETYLPIKKIIPKSLEEIFFNLTSPVSQQTMNWLHEILLSLALSVQRIINGKGKDIPPDIKTYSRYQEFSRLTKFDTFSLDEQLTKKCVLYCKKYGFSVNSFLTVAYSICIEMTRQQFPECKKQVDRIFYLVDMRKFDDNLSTSPVPAGCYIIYKYIAFKPLNFTNKNIEEEFIKLARKINKQIREQNSKNQSKYELLSHLPFARTSNRDVIDDLVCCVVDRGATLSNIGRCKSKLDDVIDSCIKVEEYYFSVTVLSPMQLSVTNLNGKMMFSLAVNGRWVDESFICYFQKNFIKVISDIVNQ